MNYLQDIGRTDPEHPMKTGKLWPPKAQGSFFAFGPNEKRELLFGIYVAFILVLCSLVV